MYISNMEPLLPPPEVKQPFYLKTTVILFGLVLFFYVLHILAGVLIPVSLACLLAILLNPLCNRLQKRLPRGIAVFIVLMTAITVTAAIVWFLSSQIAMFSQTIPALKAKFFMLAGQVQQWISNTFSVSIDKQVAMLKEFAQGTESYLGDTLSTIMGIVNILVLIPIYIYFLLYYKPLILDFIFHAFSEKHSLRVAEILAETKMSIQSYIMGLLIEMVIVSAMNSAALLMLGVRSAILIGVIGGILNVVPYLGGLVAILLPVLMATVTKEGYSTQLAILLAYIVIQFIDNNILVPKVVSSKVKINALVSILIVLMGGAIWGLSGMFLSIPFLAILKIIFDRVDGLKHWGSLFGTDIPEIHAGVKWQARFARILLRRQRAETE